MSADLAIKEPCRVATAANITLSGLQTIDGVTLSAGDRVLVRMQSTTSQNGVYVAASGAWSRATDYDGAGEAVGGTQVLVTSGASLGGTNWRIDGSGAITVGSTAVAFKRESYIIDILDYHDPADGNNITDALEAAIYTARPDLAAVQVFVPEGSYIVTRQIIPARQITLRGAGILATRIDFDDLASVNSVMKGAISFPGAAGDDPAAGSKAGSGSASFSLIEDLTLGITGERPEGLDYGLWSSGRIFANNVLVQYGGFKVCAGMQIPSEDVIAGVANASMLRNCISLESPVSGFLFQGTDANACTIIACTANDMDEYGFWDISLFGNTYLGCNTAQGVGDATSGYKTTNDVGVNSSLFSGCYAEDDFAGDNWDVATGALILEPKGTFPEPQSPVRNVTFAATEGSGLWGNHPLNLTARKQDAYPIGDASHRAARFQAEGFYIRDTNGGLAQFTAEAGGVMLLKASFPVYANNSAAVSGGLAAGSVYRTSTGEMRVVV